MFRPAGRERREKRPGNPPSPARKTLISLKDDPAGLHAKEGQKEEDEGRQMLDKDAVALDFMARGQLGERRGQALDLFVVVVVVVAINLRLRSF